MIIRKVSSLCLLLAVAAAFAQAPSPGDGNRPGPDKKMMPPMGMMDHEGGGSAEIPPQMMMDLPALQELMTEINIAKPVSAKIITIARNFRAFLDERIIKIQREELNIKEELLKENVDLQAIQGAITRKTQVFSEIEFTQIKRDLEIKSLLTQDEYDRWKSAMKQKMRQMMPRAMDRNQSPAGPNPAQK
jgi:hypothetical protein